MVVPESVVIPFSDDSSEDDVDDEYIDDDSVEVDEQEEHADATSGLRMTLLGSVGIELGIELSILKESIVVGAMCGVIPQTCFVSAFITNAFERNNGW